MVYSGHVKQGVIVLDPPAELPEGTEVRVGAVEHGSPRTLAERFADVIRAATDLPEDLAENHDHYLHGAPKR
jgi:hypothetical protein